MYIFCFIENNNSGDDMNENFELLTHIYKSSEMGAYSINNILGAIRNKANKIKNILEYELKMYEEYMHRSESILNKNDITLGNNLFAKMGNDIGIAFETMKDNSDCAIAQMLIEGFTMGVIEMESKIKDYEPVCDKDNIKMARDFLSFQQSEIEKLKAFM